MKVKFEGQEAELSDETKYAVLRTSDDVQWTFEDFPMTEKVSRHEHVEWCKQDALRYLESTDDPASAFVVMAKNLEEHEETKDHSGIKIGVGLMMVGKLSNSLEMAQFIKGFH
jgi:hypothetical protein